MDLASVLHQLNNRAPDTNGTVRFTFEVGRLVANHAERTIRSLGFGHGLALDLERHIGLIDGVFLIKARGPAAGLRRFLLGIDELTTTLAD